MFTLMLVLVVCLTTVTRETNTLAFEVPFLHQIRIHQNAVPFILPRFPPFCVMLHAVVTEQSARTGKQGEHKYSAYLLSYCFLSYLT